jgi:hypothetical protein
MGNPITPKKRERTAYQNTGNGTTTTSTPPAMSEKEEPQNVPMSTQMTIQTPVIPSPVTAEPPEPAKKQPQVVNATNTNQPSTHDMGSEVPFEDRHKKINGMLDKRLLPWWNAWMCDKDYGRSKVARFNQLVMIALIAENYDIDPTLLDQDFTWEVHKNLPRY